MHPTQNPRGELRSPTPNRSSIRIASLAIYLTATTFSLSAQEVDPDEPPERPTLETEITVTSTLPGLPEEVDLDEDQIESRSDLDLAEGLRQTSGLAATRRGPVNLDPTVRGLQEGQVGVFVDGTRTFAAGPARMDSDLSHVGLHSLQSVKVVKGPYALAWGAGTLSAIEAITFQPPFGGELRLGGKAVGGAFDNRDTRDAFGQVYGSGERLRFVFSAGAREGSDYEDGDGAEVPGDFESQQFHGSFSVRLGAGSQLDYSGGYQAQDDIDYPGRLLDATYFRTRTQRLGYSWSGARGDAWQLQGARATVYSNRKDHRMNNDEKPTGRDMPGRIPPFALDIDLPTESNTAGGALRFDLGQTSGDAPQQLALGADVYRVNQIAERFIRRRSNGFLLFQDFAWPDAQRGNVGVYGQWTRSTERSRLGVALRFDQNDAEAAQASTFFRENTVGELSRDDSSVSAAVSLSVDVNDRWTLHGGIGRAVRNPSTLELYADRFPATKFQLNAEFVGSPQLDAETSHEADAGLVARYGDVTVRADVFYREIDDYITVAADPSLPKRLPLSFNTVFRHIDGSEATFWGGELRLDHVVSRNVSWYLTFDQVRGTDELPGEPVLGLTPPRARLGARVRSGSGRLFGDVEVLVVDDQDRVATLRFEQPTPGYETLSVALGAELTSGLLLTLTGRNLTDESFADHLNAPSPFNGRRIQEPGRSVGLTLRWSR